MAATHSTAAFADAVNALIADAAASEHALMLAHAEIEKWKLRCSTVAELVESTHLYQTDNDMLLFHRSVSLGAAFQANPTPLTPQNICPGMAVYMHVQGNAMARIDLMVLARINYDECICEIVAVAAAVPATILQHQTYSGGPIELHNIGSLIVVTATRLHCDSRAVVGAAGLSSSA
jgi:hypothetical protein